MNTGTRSAVGSFQCAIQMDLPSESNLLLNGCSPSSNLALIRTVIMSPDVYWAIHSVQFTLTSRSPSTRPNYALLKKKKVKSSFLPCPPFSVSSDIHSSCDPGLDCKSCSLFILLHIHPSQHQAHPHPLCRSSWGGQKRTWGSVSFHHVGSTAMNVLRLGRKDLQAVSLSQPCSTS